jgi:hypothetical protein
MSKKIINKKFLTADLPWKFIQNSPDLSWEIEAGLQSLMSNRPLFFVIFRLLLFKL